MQWLKTLFQLDHLFFSFEENASGQEVVQPHYY
ncbi:hypothetical protein VIAG107301_01045 [Vibrio agarivorans]